MKEKLSRLNIGSSLSFLSTTFSFIWSMSEQTKQEEEEASLSKICQIHTSKKAYPSYFFCVCTWRFELRYSECQVNI